jgi:hypothetical protein
MDIADFTPRFLIPPAQQLAATIDAYCATYMVQNTANAVGTAGTSPNASSFFLDAKRKLRECLSPDGGRQIAVLEPQAESTMVAALAGQYNPQPYISSLFEKGVMPSSNALGMEWYCSQVVPAHTCGSRDDTTPIAAGYTASTGTIPYTGADSSATFTKGDVITVAGVYQVNYQTKVSTGVLQQFVVTTAVTSSGGGGDLICSPKVYASGIDQNVTAVPTTGAIVNKGTASTAYKQSLVFDPSSYAIAFAELPVPSKMEMANQKNIDGISVRFIKGFDIINSQYLCRMDCFFGIASVRPEWAVRVYGA